MSTLRDGEVLDVLVVGGGIVGAGIARDAAMRGVRCALVDQQDFAAGTSSRSSRLLHGGLRYLAQAEIGLVREASREKMVLHRIASHLAQPLAFVFPCYKNSGWSRWKLAIGVKLYDLLCGGRNLGASSVLNGEETLRLLPGLRPDGLSGAVRYFDGLTNDSRLVLDTLRSASRHGAVLSNYVAFVDATRSREVWKCELRPVGAESSLEVTAKCVVNATGPWSSRIPHSKTKLRLTKGVHLVIDRSRMPIPDAVVFAERDRILFAIPWGDRVILGTTDTDYSGPIESPRCEEEDRQYILDIVNRSFPHVNLMPDDVVSVWAGLRPLIEDKHGRPSDISRRHEVNMSSPGWWDVSGGKLTSYRLMAEETVDGIAKFLGRNGTPCGTASEPLLLSSSSPESSILPPPLEEPIVRHYCRNEWAVHLDDVMTRRTSWQHYFRDDQTKAVQVAHWMAKVLDWSDSRLQEELRAYTQSTPASCTK